MQVKPSLLSTIASIDSYSNIHYLKEFKQLKEITALKSKKNRHVISYIDSKSFISTTIKLSSNIPDEDLQEVIEDRTYSELGLDMASEFNIKYFEVPATTNEESREFHVFVVDPKIIHNQFDTIASKTEYINAIYPMPLLMRALYKRDIIRASGIHCFIYFQQHDASLIVYKNGEFIYTKSIKYSYEYLHERFCEMIGEKIDINDFIIQISQEGLKSGKLEHQEHLMNLFGELFLYINDIITYAKRAFEIDRFDKLYIGSYMGPILGINEYSQTYLSINSEDFDFNYGYETAQWYIDQVHFLLQLTYELNSESRYDCNFTLFTPPEPFFKRGSGKMIAITAASTLISLAYPVYNLVNNSLASNQISDLSSSYKIVHEKRLEHERKLHDKIGKRKAAIEKIATSKNQLIAKKKNLKAIHDKKVNYPMKGLIVADLTSLISNYRVKISEINYNEKDRQKFSFHLHSTDEKDITKLIETFTNKRANRYIFETEKISLNQARTGYKSILEVTLKWHLIQYF